MAKDRLSKIREDNEPEVKTAKGFSSISFTCVVIAAILFVLVVIRFIFHPVLVCGSSMYPTLHDGQILTSVTDFDRADISYDSIIVFRTGEKSRHYLIKRVVGCPGDTIVINKDGLFRNGDAVKDDFQKMEGGYTTVTLGSDEYFVLGDNRNNSNDSRMYGAVKYERISNIIKKY